MTLSTLTRARARIGTPERWIQYASAEDASGNRVSSWDRRAVRWCLYGTLMSVEAPTETDYEAWRIVRSLIPNGSVRDFNDTHTHAEVIALLDRAIATLGDDNAG